MRRDTSRHTEWYWLNIYDKDGEIGKQAAWKPAESMTGIWSTFAYNMFIGKINEKFFSNSKEQIEQKQVDKDRLNVLRNKQGTQVEFYNVEFMEEFHKDVEKAIEVTGKIDTKTYYV